MVTIKTFSHLAEAGLAQSLLGAAGIESFLPDEASCAAGYANVMGRVRLQVAEEDAERATRILNDHEGVEPLPDDFEVPSSGTEPEGEAGND